MTDSRKNKELLNRMNSFMFKVIKPDGSEMVIESSDVSDDPQTKKAAPKK